MILPIKQKNPPESFPIVTFGLIALNVIFYIFTSNGFEIKESALGQLALTHANASLFTLMSSMFLHGDIFHILGNMWFLWLFGAAVEGRLKPLKFLILYVLAGLAGSGLHLLVSMNQPDIPSLGASGAIMGLLGATLWMFPHSKMVVFYWLGIWFHGVWEWRMWGVGLYYLGLDLVEGLLLGSFSGVAHFAHLGGALGGFLVALALRATRDNVAVSDAKSNLAEVDDLRILGRVELAEMAKVQASDPEIALAWINRSMEYGATPDQASIAHFKKHLPNLIASGRVEHAGLIIMKLAEDPRCIPATLLYDAALKFESMGNPNMALNLLDKCVRQPDCTDSLADGAVYKLGQINEAWHNNYAKALEWFRYHQQRWPFSPMEVHVKQRIQILEQRI